MARDAEGGCGSADPIAGLVDAITDYAIFKLDRHGYVLTCNPGAERITGYARNEIIGRHFSVFYDGDAERRSREELAMAIAKGGFADEDWRVRHDGSRFWASVALTPLSGDDGRLIGFAKVIRDDTARLKAAAESRRADEAVVREQIARDLHHDVVQRLFRVALTLDAARSAAALAPEARARIDAASTGLDDTIRHIRTTLWHAAPLPSDEVTQAPLDGEAPESDGLSILVVDDDEEMRALFSAVLDDVGDVHGVGDAYEALDWIDRERVDVLVLDVLLPGANGVDLLERVRELGHDVPAVIVSGLDSGELHERALRSGASVVISKPFDKRLLLASVLEAARGF